MENATAVVADGHLEPIGKSDALVPQAITGQGIANLLAEISDVSRAAGLAATKAKFETLLAGIFALGQDAFKTVKKDFRDARKAQGYEDSSQRATDLHAIWGANQWIKLPVLDENGQPLYDTVVQIGADGKPVMNPNDAQATVEIPRMANWMPQESEYAWNSCTNAARAALKLAGITPTGGKILTDEQKEANKEKRLTSKAVEEAKVDPMTLLSMAPEERVKVLQDLDTAIQKKREELEYNALEKSAARIGKRLLEDYSGQDLLDMLTLICREAGYNCHLEKRIAEAAE